MIAAAIALIAPLPAFYSRKRRFRALRDLDIERRNGSVWMMMKQVLRFWGHWIDLFRGAIAAYGVLALIDDLGTLSTFYAAHAAWARYVLPLLCATLCVVLIGLIFRYPGKAVAPIPFVAAVLVVLVPPAVSLPALLLGGFISFSLRSLPLFFGVVAPTLAVLGFLLDRQRWPSFAGALLAITPLAIAFFRHQELVIPVRRTHS